MVEKGSMHRINSWWSPLC